MRSYGSVHIKICISILFLTSQMPDGAVIDTVVYIAEQWYKKVKSEKSSKLLLL